MTTQDYNKSNQLTRQALYTVLTELSGIKKEKLPLSARIRIERALAKVDVIRMQLDTTFQ